MFTRDLLHQYSLFLKLLQAKEARKKAIDDMDPKKKESFENIKILQILSCENPGNTRC